MADKNYGIVTVDDVADHAGPTVGGTERSKYYDRKVFDRYINIAGIVNFGFTLQAGWQSVGLTLNVIFFNGGPATAVWGTLLSGIGHTAVALSLGEMASMDPTVGAQYRWSARFSRKYPEFWGLLQGWITTFAWVVTVGAPLIYLATSTQALIAFLDESYVSKSWHATLLMWAYLLLALVCNLWTRRILNALELIGGVCHVLFFIACITILATLGDRTSASFVFTTVTNNASGWTNRGLALHLGLLAVILPLSGYDSVLHMIDETREPRKRVPKSMVLAVVMNTVMQFGYVICVMFCLGDYDKVASSSMPILEIYYQATKSKVAASIVLVMHAFPMLLCLFNIIASASRLTWAFSRDKGLPFHGFFSRVNPMYGIPMQSLGLVATVGVILSLINLGSSVAMMVIMSVPSVVLMVSYFIPIFLLTMRKLSGQHPRYGPFRLGRWGLPINIFSLFFCAYGAFWTAFPSAYPVTSVNMNYAGPIFLALILIALGDWFTSGKKRFEVPTGDYNIEMEDVDNKTGSSE